MKKVLAVLFMALAFSMTACGNSGENSDSQSSGYEETGTDSDTAAASTTAAESSAQSSESSGTSADTTSGTAAAREAIPASEAFHQKSIWFGISDDRSFAKDSFVQVAFVFDGRGNATVYNNLEMFKFSMISNDMTDDEVIEVLKELEMESRAKQGVETAPQPQPVNLHIYSDNSGNVTEEESIRYTDDESGLDGVEINRKLVVDPAVQQIYDMQFMGYGNFKTRIKDTNHPGFALDPVGTAGVPVD